MAIQFSYPSLSNLAADDLLLVSDVSTQGKPTKNITVQQIVDLVPNIVPGGGTVTSIGFNTGPLGLTVSSSAAGGANPITDSGTFTLGGILGQGYGGTGLSTSNYGSGDILYTDNSNALVTLTRGNTGQVLQLSGVAGSQLPSWQNAATGTVTSIGLATSMSGLSWTVATGESNPTTSAATFTLGGTLGLANGGTNANSQQGALDEITAASSGTNGQVLTTDGSNASWGSVTAGVTTIDFSTTGLTPNSALGGAITVGGVLATTNGGTGVSSYANGDILYGASSGTALNKLSMSSSDTGKVLTVNAAGTGVQWSNPTSGVGGSGTAGYAARWTSTSALAASGALRDDGTYVAINAVPGLANTEFVVVTPTTNTTSTTGIYYYQYNNTASIGMKSVVGDYYTGSSEIVGVQGVASGLNNTGLRYGVQGISVVPSSGTNIGIYGWTQNTGSGNSYAARFKDGNEAIGKVWVCQTAQGDGAWATSPGGGLYAVDVPTQTGTYGTIDLQKDSVVSTSVQIHPNDSTLNNSDLQVVSNQGGTDRIAVAHKDLFTGTAGNYIGIKNINISTSGHITSATAEKFSGSRPVGIKMEQASFAGENADEVLALPMISTGTGKFGDVGLQVITGGQAGASVQIAFFKGLLGAGIGIGNVLICQGSINVANIGGNQSIAVPIPDGSFTQPSPNDNFIEGENYIMVIKIPQGCKLQSASQDGDLINGGCKLSNYTPTPSTLSGINTVARVAGTPLKIPASQFISA
jgi:hypothetical protein